MDPGFLLRELFHLHFLRLLAPRLAARPYAVKGGICLRFFHRSPRLSEDIDLDVTAAIPVQTLQKNVDFILGGGALAASLRRHGVARLEFTRPKQTETTQRWKVALRGTGGAPLYTRLEISRRGLSSGIEKGIPGADLLQQAFLTPFAAAFYGAPALARQKIDALSSPSRTAARDLFDLHHLFFTVRVPLETLQKTIDAARLKQAIEKAASFGYADFRDQVLPYLTGGLQALYKTASAFETMREAVDSRLREIAS